MIGSVFTRITVTGFAGFNKHRQRLVYCQCSCGVTKIILYNHLRGNLIKSCGCLRAEQNKTVAFIHGESKGSKEYTAWMNMKARCYDPNNDEYKNYGGRGIIVCNRWLGGFLPFVEDVGRAVSSSHSIDRINNNGNYEPGNCKWSTAREQANNKRNNKKNKI